MTTPLTHKLNLTRKFIFVIAVLFVFAMLRGWIDNWWVPFYGNTKIALLTLFNTTVYIYLLHMSIPAMGAWALNHMGNKRTANERDSFEKVYYYSAFIWVCYPIVSIVTMLTGSSYHVHIEWFKYLPFFMIDANFLPTGMVAVIPIILGSYTYLFVKCFKGAIFHSFIAAFFGVLVVYLLYYQYLLNISFKVWHASNFWVFIGFYTLIFLPFMWLFTKRYAHSFQIKPSMLKAAIVVFALISLAITAYGFYNITDLDTWGSQYKRMKQ